MSHMSTLELSPAFTTARVRLVQVHDASLFAACAHFLEWRVKQDYGYQLEPEWRWDLDDLAAAYGQTPGHALFAALTPIDESLEGTTPRTIPGTLTTPLPGQPLPERVVATAAVRRGGPASPPHPPFFATRYHKPDEVAQLVRVMVATDWRRRGLARQLTAMARDFTTAQGYSTLYLHTNTKVPGAYEFWSSCAQEILDVRGTDYDTDPRFDTVHFEVPLS